ncbi:hypothetical protein TNCV_4041511 [Trichonephila clavipes]|nr:hypothetical protein TNCV_4041511 [Trichonephila clavipes]
MNLALLLKQRSSSSCLEGLGPAVSISLSFTKTYNQSSGVTVLGLPPYDRRSSIVMLQTSLTAQQYVNAILWPVVLFFMVRHLGVNFQQKKNNSRPYTTRISLDCLCIVNNFTWPVKKRLPETSGNLSTGERLPDLSTVELVWDMKGSRFGYQNIPGSVATTDKKPVRMYRRMTLRTFITLYQGVYKHVS